MKALYSQGIPGGRSCRNLDASFEWQPVVGGGPWQSDVSREDLPVDHAIALNLVGLERWVPQTFLMGEPTDMIQPIISSRKINTNVILDSGETALLGVCRPPANNAPADHSKRLLVFGHQLVHSCKVDVEIIDDDHKAEIPSPLTSSASLYTEVIKVPLRPLHLLFAKHVRAEQRDFSALRKEIQKLLNEQEAEIVQSATLSTKLGPSGRFPVGREFGFSESI